MKLNWTHKWLKTSDVEDPNRLSCVVNIINIVGNYNTTKVDLHCLIRKVSSINLEQYNLVIETDFDKCDQRYTLYANAGFSSMEEAQKHAEKKIEEFCKSLIQDIQELVRQE